MSIKMTSLPKDVIYESLTQVLRTLSFKKDAPEVKNIVRLCYQTGLVQQQPRKEPFDKEDDQLQFPEVVVVTDHLSEDMKGGEGKGYGRTNGYPFIVVEGLDGTGKTTLAKFLSAQLQMKLMATPPKKCEEFIEAREFFDTQEEPIRRAYYSLGNYLAASEVLASDQPVVMDRFWHSTAAYALAHSRKSEKPFQGSSLKWPVDLLQPDLVIFLQVSEKERLRRHSTRNTFTNTMEEQRLADDKIFRENLVQYYRNIMGPSMQELAIDGEQQESEAKILCAVLKAFPGLESRLKCSNSV